MLDYKEEVIRYSQTHAPECRATVLQYLNRYHPHSNVIPILRELHEQHRTGMQIHALMKEGKIAEADKVIREKCKEAKKHPMPEPPKLLIVVAMCPDCGEPVVGAPMPQCERAASGRVFYKECSSCTYYSEIFETKDGSYEEK